MRLFVHIADNCLTEAKQLTMETEVKKLAEKLEADQTTMGLDRYPIPFLVKKFGKVRLIIEERKDGEDCLVVFLRLLTKTNPTYKFFMRTLKCSMKKIH
jgi:hypothetical protein